MSTFEYEEYKPGDAVSQAQELLKQQIAQKPGAYQSAWQTQLDDTINKILNREKFSYDLNGDALYQQYKDQYTQQGRTAMMDTMGQAQAMTGGYGNSYAQSVGQQAYQGYLQQMNDKIPELYQLALSKYQMEGDAMAEQMAILAQQEEQDYGRYRDEVGDWQSETARLQDQYETERSFDYGKYADDRDFTYGQYSDDRAYDYQTERDKVADEQWQKEFDEAVRQFNFENGIDTTTGKTTQKATGSGGGGGGTGEGDTGEGDTGEGGTGEGVTVDDVLASLRASFPGGVVTDALTWNRAAEMVGGSDVLRKAGFSVKITSSIKGSSVGNQTYMIN